MKRKKILYFVITMALIAGLLTLPCSAVTGFTRTPLRGQQTNTWCWCACGQMLLETQNRIFTQQEIAGNISGGATITQLQTRLTACASDIQWDVHNEIYSFEKVKKAINLGWAITCYCFPSSGIGHAMAITGYDQNANGYNNIWLQDPWGNNTAPHTGVEGWCNYYAPVHGNYVNTVFAQWQGYVWKSTLV